MGLIIIIAIIILIVMVSKNKQKESAATTETAVDPTDSLIHYYEKVREVMDGNSLALGTGLILIGKLGVEQNGERMLCDPLAVWYMCHEGSGSTESSISIAKALGMEIIKGEQFGHSGHICFNKLSSVYSPEEEQAIIKKTLDKLTSSFAEDEPYLDPSGYIIISHVNKNK